MKNKQLKLTDLESDRLNLIFKTNLNRDIALNLAANIEDYSNFVYALCLIAKMQEDKREQFEYLACDENLQATKLYKDVLDIALDEKAINIARIRYVLCNIGVIESECFYDIVNLIYNSKEWLEYILNVVEELVLYGNMNLTTNIFRRLMNFNKQLVNRMCIVLSDECINSEKAYDIIVKVILGTKDININEENLNKVITCLEKVLVLKDNEAIDTILNIIDMQLDDIISKNIDIKLPEAIEISNSKNIKTFKLNF